MLFVPVDIRASQLAGTFRGDLVVTLIPDPMRHRIHGRKCLLLKNEAPP